MLDLFYFCFGGKVFLKQDKAFMIETGKRRALWPWLSGPRPKTHLPAGMTDGGGTVKPSQWDYEYSDIFLLLPGMPHVIEIAVYIPTPSVRYEFFLVFFGSV